MTTTKRGFAGVRHDPHRALAIGTFLLMTWCGIGAAFAQNQASRVALEGHVLGNLSPAKSVADVPAALTLTLVLRRDDEAGFQRYLHDVYDTQSPLYRKFLSAAQIADRFGPSQASLDQVSAYLSAQRFETIEAHRTA
jgi:subtilase family serine protease